MVVLHVLGGGHWSVQPLDLEPVLRKILEDFLGGAVESEGVAHNRLGQLLADVAVLEEIVLELVVLVVDVQCWAGIYLNPERLERLLRDHI